NPFGVFGARFPPHHVPLESLSFHSTTPSPGRPGGSPSMRRAVMVLGLIVAAALFCVLLLWNTPGTAQPVNPAPQPPHAATPLPLAQVVRFNSGVASFQREGAVEGNARIALAFPADAVNDLLKSLVLQDLGDGLISAVSYDSQEPVEKTLKSFR